MVTGVVFVDLSAAYDTVDHRCLVHKILEITKDIHLTELIESMLENRLFFVELGNKKSRWRRLKNGLPQGSMLAPLLFNIYTNDQPRTEGTCRFIYADDLGVSAQHSDFKVVEDRLPMALDELTPYYRTTSVPIHLRQRCVLPPPQPRSKAAATGYLVRYSSGTLRTPSLPRSDS